MLELVSEGSLKVKRLAEGISYEYLRGNSEVLGCERTGPCNEKQNSQSRFARSAIDHLHGARNGPMCGSKCGTAASAVGAIREKQKHHKV